MRAVVMDIKNKNMVVMKEDGTFEKVKRGSETLIGDEITLPESSVEWKKINKYAGIAASIMLVLLGSWQVRAYYTPYGYVNIDINPSIELDFNKYERVISTKGLNGDGEKVLQKTPSIKHSKLEDATRSIVETASNDNYIKKGQDNNIMFSIYTPNTEKNRALNTKINNSVLQYLKSSGRKAEFINEIVSKRDLNSAALQKISVGKLKLYEKAKAVDPSVTIDDIKNKSVRDIMKIIRDAKIEDKTEDKYKDDNGIELNTNKKISRDNQRTSTLNVSPTDEGKKNNEINYNSVKIQRKMQTELKDAEQKQKQITNAHNLNN